MEHADGGVGGFVVWFVGDVCLVENGGAVVISVVDLVVAVVVVVFTGHS